MQSLTTTRKIYVKIAGCLVTVSFALPAMANHQSGHFLEEISPIQFRPSRDTPMPDRTSGAGSRTDFFCPQDVNLRVGDSLPQPSLVALVPPNKQGLTLAARPTFWVHLPQTSARRAVLSLREDGGAFHSQSFFPITGEASIVSFELSAEAPALAVNKTYQWTVVLLCGDRPSPNDPAVTAWIRRISPPLSMPASLHRAPALQQADWYSQHGFWYDAVASLAPLRRSHSQDGAIAQAWNGFLQSAGLQSLSAEPLGASQ
jgi:Domain of Unknown Function (DUF928)